MKVLLGAFNHEKALVGAFSVIVQSVVEPMDRFAALADGGNVCFLEERSGRMLAAGINSGLLLSCGNNKIFMLLVLCRVHGLSTTHEYFPEFQIFSVKSFVKLSICETFI